VNAEENEFAGPANSFSSAFTVAATILLFGIAAYIILLQDRATPGPSFAQLDRLSHSCFRVPGRCSPVSHSRQPANRCRPRLPLRARPEPHLSRNGAALCRGHYAGAACETPGQGQGRSRRTDCRALGDSRSPAPALLFGGGDQRGDRWVVAAAESSPLSETRRHARFAVCRAGSARAAAVASRTLPVSRVEERPRQHRLSRRDRPSLLQRSVSVGRPAFRNPLHSCDCRDLPPRCTCRFSSAQQCRLPPY